MTCASKSKGEIQLTTCERARELVEKGRGKAMSSGRPTESVMNSINHVLESKP